MSTTVYGAWAPNSSQNNRMRLHVTYNVPSVSAGQTSITVTGTVYVDAYYSFYDSYATFAWSGGFFNPDGSKSVSLNVATLGSQSVHTFSQNITLTDSTQSLRLYSSLTGVDYVGGSTLAYVETWVQIPSKVYYAPYTPTNLAADRVSDSKFPITWSASSDSSHPIDSFEITRWQLWDNTWRTVANVSGSARSWTDTSSHPDDQMRYGIRAKGPGGTSSWATNSNYVWTTPDPAVDVAVERSGTDAIVSWTIEAKAAITQTLQDSYSDDDGATWSAWADITGHVGFDPSLTTRTVSGLNASYWHRIRVVSSVTSPDAIDSYSDPSNTLVLLTAPNPPTPLAPVSVVPDDEATTFMWAHNSVDTTAQTAAEVEWSDDDWASSTVESATTLPTLTVAASTWSPGTVQWRARTKGQHADWSPWSAVVSFEVAAPPALSIDSPVDLSTWTSNRLTVDFTFTDPQGAALVYTHAVLITGGQQIETRVFSTGVPSFTFNTEVADATDYTIRVGVVSGTGLSSDTAEITVTIDYVDPLPPTIEAEWVEETGTTSLFVGFTTPTGGEAVTDHVRVERSDDEGATWEIVADDLPDLAGIGDAETPLNTTPTYRAVAVSALGVEASATTTVTTTTSKVWIAGPGGSVELQHNLTLNPSFGHNRVTEEYLGDVYPTAHYGQGRTVAVALQGDWLYEEQEQDVSVILGTDVLYRDPESRMFTGSVTAVSTSHAKFNRTNVSLTVERVDG